MSRPYSPRRGASLLLCWQFCACAWAAAPQEAPQQVQVMGLRDVDEVSYRKIVKGMQVFEDNHQMAPQAALRFRLYPRAKNANFDGLVVKLASDKTEVPIRLDEKQSFSLPNDPDLARADAHVSTNRKEGSYAWRVDIRTPGLPPNTRRLGDLRLECKVDMKGAELRRIVRNPSLIAAAAVSDPCTFRNFENPFFADRPVFNVTLVYGARRESIAGEWMYVNSARLIPETIVALADWRFTRNRQYIAPLADAGWPDDTLLEFEYMDDPDQVKAEVRP